MNAKGQTPTSMKPAPAEAFGLLLLLLPLLLSKPTLVFQPTPALPLPLLLCGASLPAKEICARPPCAKASTWLPSTRIRRATEDSLALVPKRKPPLLGRRGPVQLQPESQSCSTATVGDLKMTTAAAPPPSTDRPMQSPAAKTVQTFHDKSYQETISIFGKLSTS
eukprot:COSAG01_NODE_14729_length_1417_cov_7.169954_3_plen_164_part_01